jgi:uncharacterized delta-60 repeat protein
MKNQTQKYLCPALIFLMVLAMTIIARSAPGDPDLTFGINGVFQYPGALPNILRLQDVAAGPDGRLVTAGEYTTDSGSFFAVFRHLSDGTFDSTFSPAIIRPFIGSNRPGKILVQPDGKIVVIGTTQSEAAAFVTLIRLNPDGTLDNSFNGSGFVTTRGGRASGARLLKDGKIIVVGEVINDLITGTGGHAAFRYNPNGGLDKTFGNQGVAVFNNGGHVIGFTDLEVQANGKIIVVGATSLGEDFLLMRLNNNGAADNSFGDRGSVRINIGNFDILTDVRIQGDGRILAAGDSSADLGFAGNGVLTRLLPNGTLDNSFGNGGIAFIPSIQGNLKGLAIQNNGRILVQFGRSTLFGLQPNGLLDSTFGNQGKVFTITTESGGMTFQPDGKIVVAGSAAESQITRLFGF